MAKNSLPLPDLIKTCNQSSYNSHCSRKLVLLYHVYYAKIDLAFKCRFNQL